MHALVWALPTHTSCTYMLVSSPSPRKLLFWVGERANGVAHFRKRWVEGKVHVMINNFKIVNVCSSRNTLCFNHQICPRSGLVNAQLWCYGKILKRTSLHLPYKSVKPVGQVTLLTSCSCSFGLRESLLTLSSAGLEVYQECFQNTHLSSATRYAFGWLSRDLLKSGRACS